MVLDKEETQQLSSMFADALRQAVTEATQVALASISQQQQQQQNTAQQPATSASQKPPPFTIGEFKSTETSSVADYFVRFDLALNLSKVPVADYHKYARVHMGVHLNDALRILIQPKDPQLCSYEEIKEILISHFDRKRNKFAESIKFRRIAQEKDESVSDFTLRLRKAATYCEYGEFLDRMLTEQLLFGMESRSTCDEIIAKNPSTFKIAYEIAHSLEATRQTTTDMKTSVQEPLIEPMHKLGYAPVRMKKKSFQNASKGVENETQISCYGCGGKHFRNQCKFRNTKCYKCGKAGHISRVCKSSSTSQISEEQPEENYDSIQCLNAVNSLDNKSIVKKMIKTYINGRAVEMELDTGSAYGIIGTKLLRENKIILGRKIQKADNIFQAIHTTKYHALVVFQLMLKLERKPAGFIYILWMVITMHFLEENGFHILSTKST